MNISSLNDVCINAKTRIKHCFSDRALLITCIFAVILIAINLPRIHYNTFWGDECYSILSGYSFDAFMKMGVGDAGANPPLYHLMIFVFCQVFGKTPETYQILSFIPYILILMITVTVVRKEFGFSVAIILMALCSFLTNSIYYITEVRSYEWCIFFVFVMYLSLYYILKTHEKKHYVIFTITVICAAYTHYYCLLPAFFFYAVIIYDAIVDGNNTKKKVMISIVCAIIAYAPWVLFAYRHIIERGKTFWIIEIPSIKECISYVFQSDFAIMLFIIMIITSIYIIVKQITNNNEKKTSQTAIWVLSGLICVVGSIIISITVSKTIKPLLIVRYLYPMSIVGWTLLSYSIVKCWSDELLKKTVVTSVILLVLLAGFSYFDITKDNEKTWSDETNRTLSTLSEINEEDNCCILSNVQDFPWSMVSYYFPNIKHDGFNTELIQWFDPSTQYYLFLNTPIKDVEEELNNNGYTYITIVDNGMLAHPYYTFSAYKIVPLDG